MKTLLLILVLLGSTAGYGLADIPTAEKAREATKVNLLTRFEGQLHEAIKAGTYTTYLDVTGWAKGQAQPETDQLRALGYRVEVVQTAGRTFLKISWD